MANKTPFDDARNLLRTNQPVGIVAYGAYLPRYRLPASEVARVWTGGQGTLGKMQTVMHK